MRWSIGLSSALAIGITCVAGCGDSSSANADGGTDGGGDVTVDAGPDAPPGCDLTKDPKDSPACVDDAVGIFVDGTNGDDGNAGTKLEPVKTIGAALKLTSAQQARVYVCKGVYAEDVVVDASHDGVSIYGGWRCADWSYSGTKPIVGAGTMALKLDGLTKAVTIEDMDWKSADATADGGSSIAAFVNGCANVTLVRDTLEAGKGKAGAAGKAGSNYTAVAQGDTSIKGKDGNGIVGGGPHACTLCTDGKNSTGGFGGNGGTSPGDGQDGTPNLGGINPLDGKGGAKDIGSGCTSGHKGPTGDAGIAAVAIAASGVLDPTGWKPAMGGAGSNGGPGQGGGGGGGGLDGNNTAGGAGGGGCGGCGGASGSGGGGGGASIALAVLSSTVQVASSSMASTVAGNGGAGAAGQAGQAGGFSGQNINPGCSGGTGGTGGAGGAGGGGAGGISVGVLWKGTAAPTLDSSTTSNIVFAQQGGAKGTGGAPGQNDGIDGVAQAVLEVK